MAPQHEQNPFAVITLGGKLRLAALGIGFALLGVLIGALALGLAVGSGEPRLLWALLPLTLTITALFSGLVLSVALLGSPEPTRDAMTLVNDAGGRPLKFHMNHPLDHQLEHRRRDWRAWEYAGRRSSDPSPDLKAA